MPVLHAVILGVIQGLTEVLPISSSAHLFIFPWFFKWHYQGLSFDVALHVGTAFAFIIYFFNDWVKIISSAFVRGKAHSNMFWYIVIGTVPGALAGLLLEKKAETVFRSPLLIGVMLAIFAVILWLADNFGRKDKPIESLDLKSAIMIGLAQAIAIVPGGFTFGDNDHSGIIQRVFPSGSCPVFIPACHSRCYRRRNAKII